MASHVYQETGFREPSQTSVRDFAVDVAAKPIVECTVGASPAVEAACHNLRQDVIPDHGINLTAEPDSVLYFGQNAMITQLQMVGTMLWRTLRGKVLERETHELLPHMVDGIVEFMKQQETIQKQMQERIIVLEGENSILQENILRLRNDCVNAGGHITSLMKDKNELRECLKQNSGIQSDAEGRNKRDKGDVTTGDETYLEGPSGKRVKSC